MYIENYVSLIIDIINMNNFQVDLTDVSARTSTLVPTDYMPGYDLILCTT